jgi:hypothetical protein
LPSILLQEVWEMAMVIQYLKQWMLMVFLQFQVLEGVVVAPSPALGVVVVVAQFQGMEVVVAPFQALGVGVGVGVVVVTNACHFGFCG